jgi:hypothetical protein
VRGRGGGDGDGDGDGGDDASGPEKQGGAHGARSLPARRLNPGKQRERQDGGTGR